MDDVVKEKRQPNPCDQCHSKNIPNPAESQVGRGSPMDCFIKEGSLMMSMLYRHGVTFPKDVTLLKIPLIYTNFSLQQIVFSRRQRKINAYISSNDQHNNNIYVCIVFYSI